MLLYLLGKGYRVLQVDNRAVKDYREKIFGSETKTDDTDARLMARMGFLHELVGEEFSIQPVLLVNPDAAALRGMVHDLAKLQKEITRRRNQLQQIAAVTFPELKTFFKGSTAAPAARALLEHFATPQHLAVAPIETHRRRTPRGACLQPCRSSGRTSGHAHSNSAGAPTLTHHQWRQAWLIKQLNALGERASGVGRSGSARYGHPSVRARSSKAFPSRARSGLRRSSVPLETSVGFQRSANSRPTWAGTRSSAALEHRLTDVSWPSEWRPSGANVLGQMTVIILSSTIRPTPFRDVYRRLTGRGMRPANALGHVAGKLSVVLYGMLRDMTPYDEAKNTARAWPSST